MLRRIREQCEEHGTAISVYLALTVVASDNQTDEFRTTHCWLAKLSGLSDRTVRRRLEDLKQIGAIEIDTPKLRAPCTYRLLAIGQGVRTLGHSTATPCPTSEESRKKSVPPKPEQALSTAERIGKEKQLAILKTRISALEGDTAEQWQRDEHPELVHQKQELRTRIQEIEDALL